jgi:hypothetical protein
LSYATTSDHDATLQVPSVSRVFANPQAPGGCDKAPAKINSSVSGGNSIECGETFCFEILGKLLSSFCHMKKFEFLKILCWFIKEVR